MAARKRHPIATLLEVILPVLFIALMSGLKSLTNDIPMATGWSEPGRAFSLTSTRSGFGTSYTALTVGGPSFQPKYLATEATMSGLLMHLYLRTASELRNVDLVTPSPLASCHFAVASLGRVSSDASSPNAISTECYNLVTPCRLAIVPDNAFTRKYFHETLKARHPTVEVSKSTVKATGSRVKVPAFEDSVAFFQDNAALESYIESVDYGNSIDAPDLLCDCV